MTIARRCELGLLVAGLALIGGGLRGDDAELTGTDRLLIGAQGICVVSGEVLDPEAAVRTQAGGHTVFVCCRDCLGKDVPGEVWSEVLTNWRIAQGKCPVMGRALPDNAASVVVEGRTVFVCCRPCIPRIQAEPARYLAIVDEYLAENLTNDEPQ